MNLCTITSPNNYLFCGGKIRFSTCKVGDSLTKLAKLATGFVARIFSSSSGVGFMSGNTSSDLLFSRDKYIYFSKL